MSELLSYLNSPHLVANFQKIFGIESHFNTNLYDTNTNITTTTTESLVKKQSKASSIKNDEKNLVDCSTTKTTRSRNNKKKVELELNETKIETIGPESVKYSPSNKTNQKNNNNDNTHKRDSSKVKILVNNTDHSHIVANTILHNKFWFYFFHLGASMGTEIFYCLFFPFWFWNVDSAIGRKVGFLWGIFMYFGQATKDLLCMPRPASPPVVKLEERYVKEYGFPSTHAMASAGLPISVVVLSYSRYNINLPISICIAATFCLWVCCSRLYLGMHSLLDVIAGVLYSVLILILVMPILEPIDSFMLQNEYSPLITFISGYLVCYFYPSLKQWSTARGDTTIIIGSVVGFSIGSYLSNYLGYLNKPDEPPLYNIIFPDALGYLFGVIRTILGLSTLMATRLFFKSSLLKFLCAIYKCDIKDPATRQQKKIELPFNYITYFGIGLNIAFISPLIFRYLGIQRDYSFTEL